jgi:hypothetical protein
MQYQLPINMKKLLFLILIFFVFNAKLFSQPIEINVINELNFGEIVQTEGKDISKTSSSAAKYTVISDKKRHVYIDLILPTHFTNGGHTVPVTFDATRTGWSKTNNAATSTSFNPHQQLHVQVTQNNAPIYIWLGGVINTTSLTEPGPYTGTITVKVTLNP